MTVPRGGSIPWKLGAVFVIGALALAGCSAAGTERPAADSSTSRQQETALAAAPVKVSASPKRGAVEVNPVVMPTVKATGGRLDEVTLVPISGGRAVKGRLNAAGTVWKAAERLKFHTNYTFSYTAGNAAGASITDSRSFATVMEPTEANAWAYPLDGMPVGVGQPIQINFSEPVSNKDAVERAITITSSAHQKGAFHWYNDTMLRYRGKHFWTPNSMVTLTMNLFGVDFGNGMIGNEDSTVAFATGAKRVAVVDSTSKRMKVYINDKQVRTMPVTMGMPEWPSSSGYHVIMDQQRHAKFNAGTIGLKPGDKHYYPPLTVQYASRISNSGEFVHQGLPEAMPYLGNANVSHGCIGLSPADAKWFFTHMTIGDLVHVEHSDGPELEPLEGFGDWNISWNDWVG